MKMIKKMKSPLAVFLSVLVLMSCFAVSSQAAVVTVTDEDLREYYVKEFNTVVNAVKNNRPGVTVLATGKLIEDPSSAEDRMAGIANTIVENVFANEKSLAADLLGSLTADDTTNTATAEVSYARGELNTAKVPVAGKNYVSGLSTKFKFTMKMLRNESKKRTEILIQFPETNLLDALDTTKSDLSKLFDLPTNTDIILTQNEDEVTVLEGGFFQLDDIVCTNAYVDIIYNDDLELISYTSNINYRVKVNTYTFLEGLWPTFFLLLKSRGLDVGDVASFNIISIIMKIIGAATGFDPEEAMSNVFSDYNIMYQMYELDWTPRYFGDVKYDNRVTSDDARSILRTAVGLQGINKAGDQFFADMNFDGKITADDARTALRVSVGLEKKYTSYEMRQAQLKEEWEQPDTPVLPDVPVEPDIPDQPEVPEIPII